MTTIRGFLRALVRRLNLAAGGAVATLAGIRMRTVFELEYINPDGSVGWRDRAVNTVVNVGLDNLLDVYFKGSAYTAAFYVLLTDSTPTVAATDTMASHPGWVEVTDYDEAARPTLVLGAVSGQSVSNTANKAVYSINTTVTVGGAGITTDPTKGGVTGILYGAAAFTGGDQPMTAGGTLNVTATLTAASA